MKTFIHGFKVYSRENNYIVAQKRGKNYVDTIYFGTLKEALSFIVGYLFKNNADLFMKKPSLETDTEKQNNKIEANGENQDGKKD